MFTGCTVPPDTKETELGSSNHEASPSAAKNTGAALVPCRTWKCVPTAISSGANISGVLGCHLLQQISFQWGSQKLLQGLVSHKLTAYLSVFNPFLAQWIMAILSKGCNPDNFESHISLKLSLSVNLSINQTVLTFLLCVRQLGWLNWYWQFLYEGLSSFNLKGFCYSYT